MTTEAAQRTPSAELAAFVDDVTYDDLPDDVPSVAKRCLIDTVGVTIAGLDDGAGKLALEAGDLMAGDSEKAPILGTERRTSIPNAALVLGTAAHGLDFDDVSPRLTGHPSVTLVPPILAVADDVESVTGREALTAFAAGYEVECYLDAALTPSHVEYGWHPTAILGPFGAAAVTASLLDLDRSAIRHALNICASLAAGSSANVGTMTKPLHAGHAAWAGVTAAYLADRGFTGGETAIGGEEGFFHLYSGTDEPSPVEMTPGEEWGILDDGGIFKKYPSCYYTHAGIQIMQELADEHGLSSEDIESIDVTVSEGANLECPKPTTGLEAKFSNHYTIACGLLYDEIGLDRFDDDAVPNAETDALSDRISVSVDPDLEYTSFETRIDITLTNGERLSRRQPNPPGYPGNRLTDDELESKFVDCATTMLSSDRATALLETLEQLPTLDDAGAISDAGTPAGGPSNVE